MALHPNLFLWYGVGNGSVKGKRGGAEGDGEDGWEGVSHIYI